MSQIIDMIDEWCSECYSTRELNKDEWWSSDAMSGMDVDILKTRMIELLSDAVYTTDETETKN